MDVTQARKLKEMENTKLKKLVADLSLDNAILKEVMGSTKGGLRQKNFARQEAPSCQSGCSGSGCV